MKRRIKILIAVLSVFLIISITANFVVEGNLKNLKHIVIDPIELSKVEDGIYKGKYSSIPVSATVQVTVENHRIISIRIIEHVNGQGSKAESIIDEIIRTQSIDVDVISGATYSSQVIKQAVSKALR
jgi:uncharacterized protein with FMN-binding domain